MEDAERHLFVVLPDGGQVARYTDSQWWLEYPGGQMIAGRQISVNQAVQIALRDGAEVQYGAYGGQSFYARLKRAQAIEEATPLFPKPRDE